MHHCADPSGGFFLPADDAEQLLTRPKESYDGAIPSGNSAELLDLVRIGRMTGDPVYESAADKLLRAFSGDVTAAPVRPHGAAFRSRLRARSVVRDRSRRNAG